MKLQLLALLLITGCMSSATTVEPSGPTAGSPSTEADASTNNGIFGLHDSGTAWEDTDGGLVMVPEDASAPPIDAQEPLDAGTADAELPMLDAGTPPPGKTCDPCKTDADCAAAYRCYLRPKDGVKECFLFDDTSLYDPIDPTAYTGCNKLLPLNHLRQQCYAYVPPGGVLCNKLWVCGPYDDALTCAQWKEYWGPQTTY